MILQMIRQMMQRQMMHSANDAESCGLNKSCVHLMLYCVCLKLPVNNISYIFASIGAHKWQFSTLCTPYSVRSFSLFAIFLHKIHIHCTLYIKGLKPRGKIRKEWGGEGGGKRRRGRGEGGNMRFMAVKMSWDLYKLSGFKYKPTRTLCVCAGWHRHTHTHRLTDLLTHPHTHTRTHTDTHTFHALKQNTVICIEYTLYRRCIVLSKNAIVKTLNFLIFNIKSCHKLSFSSIAV